MRILVTGSRAWADPWALELTIADFLGEEWDDEQGMPSLPGLTIMHGDCKTGLDFIAKEFCINSWINEEPHPADWTSHGRAAGPIRNQEMVESGADVCLAFPLGSSDGTRNCMDLASRAGIQVIEYKGRHRPWPRMVEWNATHRPY